MWAITNLIVRLYVMTAGWFINGNEVMRENMPTGPITYTTPAAPSFRSQFFDQCQRRAGRQNVVAVEIHQATLNSSDVSQSSVAVRRAARTTPSRLTITLVARPRPPFSDARYFRGYRYCP
jgi:hypothetical protein